MCYSESISSIMMMTSPPPIIAKRRSISIPEEDDTINRHHDSIVSTSSLMVGNFFPIDDKDNSVDDNDSEVDDDDYNITTTTQEERHHNRQLSQSSPTRGRRCSMTRLLSSLQSSPRKQPQQVSNSINSSKQKKRLFSRRSFRHSQSCNDIDISNIKQTNNKTDRSLTKKRSFLFRSNRCPKSSNNNDIKENEDQHHDLRLRTSSSFDIASTSDKATSTSCSSSSNNNDNDSFCSVVSSNEDMMEYDNNDCIGYDCNKEKTNVDDDSYNQQPQVQEQLPDLYAQIHVNETQELVEESLQQMNIELIQHNDKNERFAEEKCLIDGKINCTKIKLLFLRSCCFRISEAVGKYIKYWNKRMLLFGMERAFNPITLLSLTPSELHILESGTIGIVKKQHATVEQYNELLQQTTKSNDDKYVETRDIIIFDYTLYDKKIMATLDYTRLVWYIFHSIMEDSGCSQRGVIFIVTTKNCVMKQLPAFDFMKTHMSYFHNAVPVRLSGMHIIYMPTVIRCVVPILNRLLDEIIRQRLIFHTDIKNETQCLTKLYNKYGIHKNMIPKHIGGTHEWNMKNIWIPKQLLYESNNVADM